MGYVNNAILLNDNTYLYSPHMVREYLSSLGFDDLDSLVYMLRPDIEDLDNGACNNGDNYELIADGYFNAYNNLCDEVDFMCEKFLSGRSITKAEFVRRLKFMMEDALLDY